MQKTNYEKVNERVRKTSHVYKQFYLDCLEQKVLSINLEIKDIGSAPSSDVTALKRLRNLYRSVLQEMKTYDEDEYGTRVWIALLALSHQLLLANQDAYPKEVPMMKAHFEYCCRHLMDAYPHDRQGQVLSTIYRITSGNHKYTEALIPNSPILDMKHWNYDSRDDEK